ncbi:hypothetical protein GP486_003792 [Trichoglossum hirsutum]|uniref:Uncharacterized protein n=1 Tax=Trichoglossum hirsutum TaxID=265104 RepID=A0A9P8RQP8_9PEZI|nr:hypothetical protein GP486_003792 [Trichoglossum hirsutum]
MQATASSKPLLLYQLGALPGLKHGLEDLSVQELLYCFQQRAAKHLCGVDVLASATLFTFEFSNFAVRQSMFFPQFKGTDCLFMVHHHEPCVSVFTLGPRGLPPRFKMAVDLREIYESEEPCKMNILRIAVSPSGCCWAILYSHESIMTEIPTTFVKERLKVRPAQASPRPSFKLAILSQESDMYHLTFDDRKFELTDFHQLGGLAISDSECVAICGTYNSKGRVWSEVRAYRKRYVGRVSGNVDVEGRHEVPAKLSLTSSFSTHYDGGLPIRDVKFNSDGSQLLLFDLASPIHQRYLEDPEDDEHEPAPIGVNCLSVGGFSLHEEPMGQRELYIGIPFYSSHITRESDSGTRGPTCTDVWLSIGTEAGFRTDDAYVVRSTRSRSFQYCSCKLDPDFHRQRCDWDSLIDLEWYVLVQLKGFSRGSSSLGPVAAISKDSRRLVVADWKDIRLWPLDPDGLIQNEEEHYRHTNRQSNFEIFSGIGSIEPYDLRTNGDVIHKLYFVSSDILYAVTDHGITMWDLGSQTGGSPKGPLLIGQHNTTA